MIWLQGVLSTVDFPQVTCEPAATSTGGGRGGLSSSLPRWSLTLTRIDASLVPTGISRGWCLWLRCLGMTMASSNRLH